MNPLLPRKYFTPDVEARKMPDGRLYLYGSNDLAGSRNYCSKIYHVFSTDDPVKGEFVCHGVSFENTLENPCVPGHAGETLYAPDAVFKDGKYYLYYCGASAFEGVAVSDSPTGPFENAVPVQGADGDGIDPAVFVDDDGKAYYLWGQFSLKGAQLNHDMASFVPGSEKTGILTEHEHGFHEGASLRKRNGKYYLVYTDISRGRATCLSYAVADRPLGPYQKGGVIIDNIYCDPQSWNNHGSIEEFGGQWYVFYHRSSRNSNTSRRVCAEPIFFREDGSIPEVVMTSQGASGPISAFSEIDASVACRMKGNCRIAFDGENETNEILTGCGGGSWTDDWAEYRYLDFENGAARFSVRARGEGVIRLRVSGKSESVGEVRINSKAAFETYATELSRKLTGVQALWLFFEGADISVDAFSFHKAF